MIATRAFFASLVALANFSIGASISAVPGANVMKRATIGKCTDAQMAKVNAAHDVVRKYEAAAADLLTSYPNSTLEKEWFGDGDHGSRMGTVAVMKGGDPWYNIHCLPDYCKGISQGNPYAICNDQIDGYAVIICDAGFDLPAEGKDSLAVALFSSLYACTEFGFDQKWYGKEVCKHTGVSDPRYLRYMTYCNAGFAAEAAGM